MVMVHAGKRVGVNRAMLATARPSCISFSRSASGDNDFEYFYRKIW